jgi:hypothetical protein
MHVLIKESRSSSVSSDKDFGVSSYINKLFGDLESVTRVRDGYPSTSSHTKDA